MAHVRVWSIVLLSLCVLVLPVYAAAPTMPADQVERGMIGFGLTVFQGTKIDTFRAEILGVMRNWVPKGDLIVARLSGGPLEETTVIAGMSGSPVYIDGKLIGAVAYGWRFSKEPICGITPIEEMIRTLDRGVDASPEMGALPPPSIPEIPVSPKIARADGLGGATLIPLTPPLVLSGFDRRVVDRMAEELSGYGFAPAQGGAGSDAERKDIPFRPGAALGVQFIRGDLSATGIGTLTYRDGDRVVGFGHPLFSSGGTDLPMTNAYIHDVIPSRMWSTKIGSAGRVVGAIRQDRRAAIAGVMGAVPDMMPISVRIGDGGDTYEFQVLRHRELGPLFAGYAVFNTILSAERRAGDATVRALAYIELEGHPSVERENVYSGSAALLESARGLVAPVSVLIRNRFERVRIERVRIEIEVEESRRTALIEEVLVDRLRLRPGEHVDAKILLRPYLAEPFEQEISVCIPPEVPDGELILLVGDARSVQAMEQSRAPGRYTPGDLPHLLDLLAYEERNDELIVELISPDRGVTVQAQELPSLPLSMLFVLDGSERPRATRPVSGHVLARRQVRTDYVLSGGRTLRITVDRHAR